MAEGGGVAHRVDSLADEAGHDQTRGRDFHGVLADLSHRFLDIAQAPLVPIPRPSHCEALALEPKALCPNPLGQQQQTGAQQDYTRRNQRSLHGLSSLEDRVIGAGTVGQSGGPGVLKPDEGGYTTPPSSSQKILLKNRRIRRLSASYLRFVQITGTGLSAGPRSRSQLRYRRRRLRQVPAENQTH